MSRVDYTAEQAVKMLYPFEFTEIENHYNGEIGSTVKSNDLTVGLIRAFECRRQGRLVTWDEITGVRNNDGTFKPGMSYGDIEDYFASETEASESEKEVSGEPNISPDSASLQVSPLAIITT